MTERPAPPPPGSVAAEELGARLDEMIDRVLADEEIVVLRESTALPCASIVAAGTPDPARHQDREGDP